MIAAVFTLGCKVNEVESGEIMSALEKSGISVTDKLCYADIYVLNTCAVTREAERKSRQLISRVKKYNPSAAIYVCGCASQKNAAQFEKEGVRFVYGAQNKMRVAETILKDVFGENAVCPSECYPKAVRTRAFVKIEDGCNNFCSYCVIPYLRGRVRSRKIEDVVAEVKQISAPEIVLTGINVSAFGEEEGGLTALMCALAFTEKRVRLGSLECSVIDDGFLMACKSLKDFAPQFHLSLQSGSNAVLKAMNRHYTREEYLQKCALIYSYFPDAAITTDIIVGFCGETEEDFLSSLNIVEEAGFARVHAFAFSPREGTAAFKMPDVPDGIKKRRLHELLEKAAQAAQNYCKHRLGREYEVIFEEFDGEYTGAYTGSYIRVYVRGEQSGKGKVRLNEPFRDGVLGEITG